MNIPFIDLKSQYAGIKDQIRERIDTVLEHGRYIMGPEIGELEEKLAAFAGTKHAIACSSGTDALLMALMAWGIGPGDAVLTTPFTFIATAEVCTLLGATPVFVDIDPKTFNIDTERLELACKAFKNGDRELHPMPENFEEITPKAVIPVDLFGLPAEYDAIDAIAEKYGLLVLEDTAQGYGGTYKGRPAGCFGHAAATSFFPAKPLGAYGDAGAVFTNDDELHETMLSIRVHGMGSYKYDNLRTGLTARMDSLQAAILLPKLDIFPDELKARDKWAALYTKKLKDIVVTPSVPEGMTSAWAQYSILVENRDAVQAKLSEMGVPTMIYYPIPLHLQTVYKGLGYQHGDFPVCERIAEQIISLPMHPYLTEELIDEVVGAVRKAVGK